MVKFIDSNLWLADSDFSDDFDDSVDSNDFNDSK